MKISLQPLVPAVLVLLAACASTARDDAASAPGSSDSGAAANVTFEGTTWLLADVGGKAAIPGVGTRRASLSFGADSGSVTGNSGINSFFGPYALDGAHLRIENLAMTRMAGSPELMAQESAFTAALSATRSWRLRGQILELLDEKGSLLASLRAATGN